MAQIMLGEISTEIAHILGGSRKPGKRRPRPAPATTDGELEKVALIEASVTRAQFFTMATAFKRRLRECDVLTPEVETLVARADEALEKDDLPGAAGTFQDISTS